MFTKLLSDVALWFLFLCMLGHLTWFLFNPISDKFNLLPRNFEALCGCLTHLITAIIGLIKIGQVQIIQARTYSIDLLGLLDLLSFIIFFKNPLKNFGFRFRNFNLIFSITHLSLIYFLLNAEHGRRMGILSSSDIIPNAIFAISITCRNND